MEKIIVIRESADSYCIYYPDGSTKGGLFKHQIGNYIDDWFHCKDKYISEAEFISQYDNAYGRDENGEWL